MAEKSENVQTRFTLCIFEVLNNFPQGSPQLTFDPAHGVDNDRSFSALGASTPQGLKAFQVAV